MNTSSNGFSTPLSDALLWQTAEILSQQRVNIVFQPSLKGGMFRRSSIALSDIPSVITDKLTSLTEGEFLLAVRPENRPEQIVSALRRCLHQKESPLSAFAAEGILVRGENQFKKVILIAPIGNFAGDTAPVIVPHPGIEKIVAYLLSSSTNVDARAFNPNLANLKRLKSLLSKEFFQIIGFSLLSATLRKDAEAIDLAAILSPHSLLIGGGPNMRHLPHEEISKALPFDMLVEGAGEATLSRIVEAVPLTGKYPELDLVKKFGHLSNLIIFDRNRKQTLITRHKFIMPPKIDADIIRRNIPYHYDDITHGTHYNARKDEVGQATDIPYHMIGNRPYFIRNSDLCLHHCQFCFISREKVKPTGPQALVAEMIDVINSGSLYDSIHFIDNDFFVFPDQVIGICEEIITKNLSEIPKYCKGCADEVTLELLRLLRKAGFRMVGFGIESFDDQILTSMNKQINAEQNSAAIQWTLEAGLKPGLNLIAFSPWETPESLWHTLERALFYAAHGAYINLMPLMCVNLGDAFSSDPANQEMIEYMSLSFQSTGHAFRLPTQVRLRPEMAYLHARVLKREVELANSVRRLYRSEKSTLSQAVRSLTFIQSYFELLQIQKPDLANRLSPQIELARQLVELTLSWEADRVILPDLTKLRGLRDLAIE